MNIWKWIIDETLKKKHTHARPLDNWNRVRHLINSVWYRCHFRCYRDSRIEKIVERYELTTRERLSVFRSWQSKVHFQWMRIQWKLFWMANRYIKSRTPSFFMNLNEICSVQFSNVQNWILIIMPISENVYVTQMMSCIFLFNKIKHREQTNEKLTSLCSDDAFGLILVMSYDFWW